MILAAGLLIAACNPRDEAASKDRERLQGSWELLTLQANLQQLLEMDLDDLPEARLVFQDEGCHLRIGGTDLEMTYLLNARKSPRAIDLTVTAGPDKGKKFRAIYVLDGDTIKLCYHPQPGKERPGAFANAADSGFMVLTWRRLKP
jgi:uncharacterized protein (TIGR03067 family)